MVLAHPRLIVLSGQTHQTCGLQDLKRGAESELPKQVAQSLLADVQVRVVP
jgi:hypothetical protein